MNPERFSFIVVHDLLGWDAARIAKRLTAEVEAVGEKEVQTLMDSPLYLAERAEILDGFRRNSVREAADALTIAAHDCVVFLRSVINNYTYKPHLQIKVAMDFLDRVPQTSKTLRQYISTEDASPITDDQLEHLYNQMYVDPRAQAIMHNQEEKAFKDNMKKALDGLKN